MNVPVSRSVGCCGPLNVPVAGSMAGLSPITSSSPRPNRPTSTFAATVPGCVRGIVDFVPAADSSEDGVERTLLMSKAVTL